MRDSVYTKWEDRIVSSERVIEKIRPGMSIFVGTGAAEPRTLVKKLMSSDSGNLQDLELIQLVSFGDAISLKKLRRHQYRLKTFFSGWVADEAITEGQVDLVPSRFAWIPKLIESGHISINAAFIQVTPPDGNGNCSLGVAIDVARQAMERASLVVGEINTQIPRTYGDTFVHISDFDLLVHSTQEPIYFDRWLVSDIFDKIAINVSSLIEDGTCIAFSIGPLFEALGRHLIHKRHLGIHSPFFTDSLMDLVTSGAVTNRYKETYRGKSLASYALGTPKLMSWLDQNPLVEFQGIDKVFHPSQIGRNPRFIAVLPARKVDLSGRIALQIGKGNVATGPAEVLDFFHGAEISAGGRTVFAIPSRNRNGKSNIRVSIKEFPNQFSLRESIDMVVSEHGVASLKGYTIRQRAQALIDIAHPDDRPALIDQAKAEKIIYHDQIYLAESAHLYPKEITQKHTFKGGIEVSFRGIKPSDEEEMRRLFYRFSDMAVYYRYFGHIAAMPHTKTQEYVNVDWNHTMSIVGLADDAGHTRVIAEARFIKEPNGSYAEVVFVVDEEYQGLGIGTYLYKMLVHLAKERGIIGFTADVLFSNIGMMKVFKKGKLPVKATLENGVYQLTIPFDTKPSSFGSNIH
ncbi:MAG: GNAT family N-acetyltransferase [Thermodesulfobacteriota bacterium]|nr:GNAT family N-acetyltransferase [Thermodesulfobacteriota bacterium]